MIQTEVLKNMTAEEVLKVIATDWVELSQEKIRIQRDDHMTLARKWLALQNGAEV